MAAPDLASTIRALLNYGVAPSEVSAALVNAINQATPINLQGQVVVLTPVAANIATLDVQAPAAGATTASSLVVRGLSTQNDGFLQLFNSSTSTQVGGIGGGALVAGQGVNDLAIWPGGQNFIVGVGNGTQVDFKISGTAAVPLIQGFGATAGALVDMTPDSGSFTCTAQGITGTPTGTAFWTRIGNIAVVTLPAITGTSSGTAFSYTFVQPTGLPVPTHGQSPGVIPFAEDNTATAEAGVQITNGTFTFLKFGSGSVNSWTNGGTKGLSTSNTIVYMTN